MTAIPPSLQIAIDRELGARSFSEFVQRAWPLVEPNPLRWSWHMGAICEHLEAVSRGQIRDLVISVPPGTSKSLLVSTFWGAWDWIRCPTRRWIAATYGQELSEKNAKLQRDLILSSWYQARWGDRVRIGKDDVAKVRLFELQSKGWRFSTSVGGPATGRHADILLGDDLAKAQAADGRAAVDPVEIEAANKFWFSTMHTRRADAQTTAKVLIAQRIHHEDTPGKAMERGYTALVLPMEFDPTRRCVTSWPGGGFQDPRTEKGELLQPARFPRSVVDNDRIVMGPQAFEAQMQQNPTPSDGLLFKAAGRVRWIEIPEKARRIITVDAAFKGTEHSDPVSIQVWAKEGTRYYLEDNDTDRRTFGATVEAIRRMKAQHPRAYSIHIEDKANGPAIIDTLGREIAGVVPWNPGPTSKVARAEAVAPLFEAGCVYLPPDDKAPWINHYLTELRRFPLGKHDDQVDGTTMALLILHTPGNAQYAGFVKALRG